MSVILCITTGKITWHCISPKMLRLEEFPPLNPANKSCQIVESSMVIHQHAESFSEMLERNREVDIGPWDTVLELQVYSQVNHCSIAAQKKTHTHPKKTPAPV